VGGGGKEGKKSQETPLRIQFGTNKNHVVCETRGRVGGGLFATSKKRTGGECTEQKGASGCLRIETWVSQGTRDMKFPWRSRPRQTEKEPGGQKIRVGPNKGKGLLARGAHKAGDSGGKGRGGKKTGRISTKMKNKGDAFDKMISAIQNFNLCPSRG